jgi:hypothetical protein
MNPTLEANILRAILVKKKYGVVFTNHLKEYIYQKMLSLNDLYGNAVDRLLTVRAKYPKYVSVSEQDVVSTYEELKRDMYQPLFG